MRVAAGATDVTVYFKLVDPSTGDEETALVITDLDLTYIRDRAAAVKADATELAAVDSVHGDNKMKEVDSTNAKGMYRADFPDAAFAAGVDKVQLICAGAAIDTAVIECEIGAVPADITHIHGTALTETAGQLAGAFKKFFDVASPTATCLSLPDALPGAANGMFIAGSNAATTLASLVVSGTTTLTGAVSFASTFAIAELTTLDSLTVTNATTFTGEVALGASLTLTGSIAVGANVDITGTLDVAGTVTLTDLSLSGDLAIGGTTTFTGNVSLGGTLAVTGTTTFTGAVTCTGGLVTNVTGNLSGSVGSIGSGGIVAASFAADSIAAATFATGALTADAFAADALAAATFATGAFTADAFAADAFVAATFATDSITSDALAASATAEIAAAVADADRGTILETTTIATLATQTSFTLTAGCDQDDPYNTQMIVIEDAADATLKAVGYIADYTGATKTVTLQADPGIFTMAVGDKVTIIANPHVTGGTGKNLITITVDDGTDPIEGVTCWITTDSAGANDIKSGTTNASGIMTNKPHLADGTYYVWLSHSGYDMTNSPETLTVAGTAGAYAKTFSMTAAVGGGGTDSGYLEYDASDVMECVKAYIGGTVTDAAGMAHVVAGSSKVYKAVDPRTGHRHHFSFLEPEDTLVLWATATGTMSVSTTTITDSTNSPFYETMVGHTLVADTSETEYTITGYTSSSVITVSADATDDNGDTFTITATGEYYLPARYRGIKENPVFAYDDDGNKYPLHERSPETIYELWRATDDAGYTENWALVADTHDTSTTQKYKMIVAPIPSDDMTTRARFIQRIPDPAVDQHFLGGPTVSMAIRAASMADAEIITGNTKGIWAEEAKELLISAIDEDKETITTHDTEQMETG